MTRRPTAAAAALLAALTLGATGCGRDSDPADPSTSPTPTASTNSTAPTPSATGGAPADWEEKFTTEELSAARNAMHTWERFRPRLDEIYKKGKLTPEAKKTLQEYSFFWQRDIVTLGETYEKGGLRLVEGVAPLWSYVNSVRLNKDGTGQVVIVQCTD